MLSQITFACALIMGAIATDSEMYGRGGYGNDRGIQGLLHPGAGRSYRPAGGSGHGGYGGGDSYGFPWVRRSTIRPRDVKAYNVEPVDNYWKHAPQEQ